MALKEHWTHLCKVNNHAIHYQWSGYSMLMDLVLFVTLVTPTLHHPPAVQIDCCLLRSPLLEQVHIFLCEAASTLKFFEFPTATIKYKTHVNPTRNSSDTDNETWNYAISRKYSINTFLLLCAGFLLSCNLFANFFCLHKKTCIKIPSQAIRRNN